MSNKIPALKVQQWLIDWDKVHFNEKGRRKKPQDHFFIFSIPAKDLIKLSEVYRRTPDRPRSEDTNIQRKLIPERSREIREFIKGGFPWSILSDNKRKSEDFRDLRMPGWLPTAIIANILPPKAIRKGKQINDKHLIKLKTDGPECQIILPDSFSSNSWKPDVAPLEIIDGQHRLHAFEDEFKLNGDFELPVVAFYDLDITWQAYLFYTINIKPKKINTSLAYDLYPILRVQDWLEKSPDGAIIYRETRAQEITEILWSYDNSPWKNRINMLGDSKSGAVTQAAFIRSLINSYVKSWGGPKSKLGGLFGSTISSINEDILGWTRTQQSAFIIFIWTLVEKSIKDTTSAWAKVLRDDFKRRNPDYKGKLDPAFISEFSLLATDQGVRGILQITNDLCYVGAKELNLSEWYLEFKDDTINLELIDEAVKSLYKHAKIKSFFESTFSVLSSFDWRTSSAPGFKDEASKINQMAFRGSGGYKELRRQLLKLLVDKGEKQVKSLSKLVLDYLGYEREG